MPIDKDKAKRDGRKVLPKDGLADWAEKCTWDKLCGGCAQCDDPTVSCDPFCSEISNAACTPREL